MRAASAHRQHIEIVAKAAKASGIELDDRDVVPLSTQSFGHIGPDLARSDHDDSHLVVLAAVPGVRSDRGIEATGCELDRLVLCDHCVDPDVPRFRRNLGHLLDGVSDADHDKRPTIRAAERSIVETAALAETVPSPVEGNQRCQNHIVAGEPDDIAVDGFGDAERARLHGIVVGPTNELEVLAVDPWDGDRRVAFGQKQHGGIDVELIAVDGPMDAHQILRSDSEQVPSNL